MHMICPQWHRRTHGGVPGCLSVQLLLTKLCLAAGGNPVSAFSDESGVGRADGLLRGRAASISVRPPNFAALSTVDLTVS